MEEIGYSNDANATHDLGLAADFVEGIIYVRRADNFNSVQTITGAVRNITGHDPAEFLNGSVCLDDLVVSEDIEKYNFIRSEETKTVSHYSIVHYRINHKTRGIVHVREKFKYYYNSQDQIQYFVGNIVDETLELANATSQNELLAFREAIDRFLICTITDTFGKIIYANRRFSIRSGYTIKEILGNTHKIVHSGSENKQFWISFWNTIQGGKVWKGVVRNKTRKGEYYWEEKVVMPVFDSSGNIQNYISLSFDITNRWKLEEKTNFFKKAIDVSPDMIFLTDLATLRICDWNSPTLSTLGYGSDVLREMRITELFQDVTENEIRHYVNDVVNNKLGKGIFEAKMLTGKGEILSTEIGFSIYESRESGAQLVLSVRDITNKHELQRAIETHKVELAEAGSIAKLGTWIWSPQSGRVVLSEGASVIMGLSKGENEIAFRDFQKYVHPADQHLLNKSVINIFNNTTPQAYNYRIATSAGTEKHIMLKRHKITYTKEGKIETVIGFVQDITEFRLSQMENEYYHEKMEQLMFQTSHHLRASVSTILGALELFKSDQLKPEEYKLFLGYISDAANEADENLRFIFRKLQEGKSSQ